MSDRLLWLKSPRLLLERLGITEPHEIDIEAIAQACGATILYQELEGCEGRLVGAGRRAIITVNARSARVRQRFSAAHELGHWIYDRGHVAFACGGGEGGGELTLAWGHGGRERRANRFAAELLLPRAMLKQRLRVSRLDFALIKALGDEFTTSLSATAIRAVECGGWPHVLACYERGARRWSVAGAPVPPTLKVRPSLPDWGASARHRGARPRPAGGAPFPAELWLDHPDAIFYTVYAERLALGADVDLVLLGWEDEDQLKQLLH